MYGACIKFLNFNFRLMVSEIRRRASNKTTEDASQAIVNFLEMPKETGLECDSNSHLILQVAPPSSEVQSINHSSSSQSKSIQASCDLNTSNNQKNQKGWILLSTLNLLVCNGSAALVPIMAATSLPSTLVKCLYLFFDLPAPNDEESPKTEEISSIQSHQRPQVAAQTRHQRRKLPPSNSCQGISMLLSPEESAASMSEPSTPSSPASSNFLTAATNLTIERLSSKDRRHLLQRVFTQLLTKLCSHQSSLTELSRKDDLALLFNAITSWCPKHNQLWRQSAADVIVTMARNQVTNCPYIHEKNCINICVENMSRMAELSTTRPSEISDMLSALINFLYELASSGPANGATLLLDDFKSSLGYHLLVDFCLKLEVALPEDQESLERVINLIQQFTKVGIGELKPRPLSVNQLFIMDDFSMPRPSRKDSIRNLSAFNVLQTLWIKARSTELQELVLCALLNLYREDHANYFILDSQNTLSQFAEKLQIKQIHIQVCLFRMFFN